MKEIELSDTTRDRLREIYAELQKEYENVATALAFTCTGCPDNCCDSYFLHYTYIEWAYLWEGLLELDPDVLAGVVERAEDYHLKSRACLERGDRPLFMCPLNDGGLCSLYRHRLLVCRTHGVPAVMTRPDGRTMKFPGCFRCQALVEAKVGENMPFVERTEKLRRLAMLEQELLHNRRHLLPKVKLTIAEMIVKGPPRLVPANNGMK
jgi:Fe-S-cluster containining protein